MLGKLRGRSLGELRVRGLQAAHALVERAGVGVGAPRRVLPTLALPVVAEPSWDAAIAARWPEHVTTIVERAERVLRGEYDLLGFDALAAGTPPDWHRDPDSGLRAPEGHWSRVPYLDPAVVGDHKVTWELNRHQYLVTLAQAWRLTRDRRYAHGVATLLDDWMRANPPTRGMNWASALEVAFRAIAWTWTLALLHDAPVPDAALRQRAAGMLHAHGRHLARYLSIYFSPNTHLTGEALGLLYLGVACPGLPRAARWRARGSQILHAEAARQIRADGTYFEQTTWYQHYTVEFYLHAQRLWETSGTPVPRLVRERAERAAEVLAAVLRPDGSIPLFGDDDGGRTLPLDGRRPGDFRDTLAVAAVRFGRADFARRAGALPPGAAWLLGPDGVASYDALLRQAADDVASRAPRAVEARAFPDGGLYVLRDGPEALASLLVLDAGRHGELTSGHSHADALAFDLTVDGRPTLVDAGTHRYVGPTRDRFRSASAHNTVSIDGRSAAEPNGAFRWASVAHARVRAFAPTAWGGALSAEVEGWPHRTGGARHRRALVWRAGAYWLLIDQIDAEGPAEVALHFQAAAGLDAVATGADGWRLVDADGASVLRAQVVPLGVTGVLEARDGRVSRSYGASEPAAALCWRATGAGRVLVATLLVPAGGPTPTLHADGDGAGWTVDVGGDRHRVRTDAAPALTHGDATLAGALVWTRAADADAMPDECLVLAPTGGSLGGQPIAPMPGGWLRATRVGDAWQRTAGS
jgi:hypothetical protein